jgi:hypothetical protein
MERSPGRSTTNVRRQGRAGRMMLGVASIAFGFFMVFGEPLPEEGSVHLFGHHGLEINDFVALPFLLVPLVLLAWSRRRTKPRDGARQSS